MKTLFALFSLLAAQLATAATPAECQLQAEATVKEILLLQGASPVLMKTTKIEKEEDVENTYLTFFIEGYSRDEKGVLVLTQTPSRITMIPKTDGKCIMSDYALPAAT
jgi:hypothetical protein